jgi:hypothetical protein
MLLPRFGMQFWCAIKLGFVTFCERKCVTILTIARDKILHLLALYW